MVDVASTGDDGRPETRMSQAPGGSDFKQYLEQNPEMANQIMKVMLDLWQDPAKESEAAA